MSRAPESASLFRERTANAHHRVTFVELFFDLVFVFAVTQLSHRLLDDFTPLGLLQCGLLLLAVWWVWVYTSWVTNWLDPDRPLVRLLLFALMLAGLGLSTSIPKAFESRGIVFASTYAAMQVGRTAFMTWKIPRDNTALRVTFARILVWFTFAGSLWMTGGVLEGPSQLPLWGVALAIEYLGPAVRYWTPVLGASQVSDWDIEGGHLAERCALFVIIALGESVLMTGATFADSDWTALSLAAFVVAFVGTLAMWWLYFDKGAEFGSETIRQAADPGRLGRLAYTYLHLPIVGGIILSAVADELVLAHPAGHVDVKTAISVIGGPLIYVVGVVLFKRTLRGWLQPSHLAGIVALAALTLAVPHISPLALATGSASVLVIVAAWESKRLPAL